MSHTGPLPVNSLEELIKIRDRNLKETERLEAMYDKLAEERKWAKEDLVHMLWEIAKTGRREILQYGSMSLVECEYALAVLEVRMDTERDKEQKGRIDSQIKMVWLVIVSHQELYDRVKKMAEFLEVSQPYHGQYMEGKRAIKRLVGEEKKE